jgi:hypothetical protein
LQLQETEIFGPGSMPACLVVLQSDMKQDFAANTFPLPSDCNLQLPSSEHLGPHPTRTSPLANSSPIKATTKILLFFIEKPPCGLSRRLLKHYSYEQAGESISARVGNVNTYYKITIEIF